MSSAISFDAPRLIVEVEVSHSKNRTSKKLNSIDGRIDTASSVSAVPLKMISGLGIRPRGWNVYEDFNEEKFRKYKYPVKLLIRNPETHQKLLQRTLLVITTPKEHALIGWDVLLNFKLLVDAKKHAFTLKNA